MASGEVFEIGRIAAWESAVVWLLRHGFPDGIFMRRHAEGWQALLTDYRRRIS